MTGQFKIVKTEYDVLAERYNKLELGTLSVTLAEALGISPDQSNKLSSSDVEDFVVDTGSSGGWYYRKWDGGKVELWGYFSQTVTAYAANAFILGSASVTPYPFSVTSPIAQATCEKIGTGGGIVTYDYRRTDYWSAIANGINQSPAQGQSRTITWSVYVIANWK